MGGGEIPADGAVAARPSLVEAWARRDRIRQAGKRKAKAVQAEASLRDLLEEQERHPEVDDERDEDPSKR